MLSVKQKKCLEIMILGDKTDKEIAQAINVSQKTICTWKKQEEFVEEYNSMMRTCLQYAAPKAFQRQLSLLNSKNAAVAHMAAKDLLDRAGFRAEEKLSLGGSVPVQIVDDL